MGFLYPDIKIPKAIPITLILNMLSQFKSMIIVAISHLGLYRPPPEQDYYSRRNNSNNYIVILDGLSPSMITVPVDVATEAIKKRVPVVKYGDFLESIGGEEEYEEKVCTICLDCVEKGDEIRELNSCSHVFHRECLDRWVDEGQVTCPLCISMLLPPKDILTSSRCCAGS